MLTLREMDPTVTVRDQLAEAGEEPVTVINPFNVAPDDVDAFVTAWADDAAYFKSQPGFISTQLHRGTAGSCTFLNYAVWETVAHFRAAFGNPEFQAKLAAYPNTSVASPHLFRKVHISGICLA